MQYHIAFMLESNGSVNYEDALARGYGVGECRYASMEPHHERSEFGAWSYVNMFHVATEELLAGIIEKTRPGRATDLWLRWSETEGARLVRSVGNAVEEIRIPDDILDCDIDLEIGDGEFETFEGAIVWPSNPLYSRS